MGKVVRSHAVQRVAEDLFSAKLYKQKERIDLLEREVEKLKSKIESFTPVEVQEIKSIPERSKK